MTLYHSGPETKDNKGQGNCGKSVTMTTCGTAYMYHGFMSGQVANGLFEEIFAYCNY